MPDPNRAVLVVLRSPASLLTCALVGALALVGVGCRNAKPRQLGNEFTYDLTDYQKTDASLLGYRETEPIELPLTDVSALAVGPGDSICVAGRNAVRRFARDGSPLGETQVTGTPRCVAAAEDGRLYVGLKDHVAVYGADGNRTASWAGLGGKAIVTSVAVTHSDVFVADAGNRVVLRYTPEGKLVCRIGKKDADRNVPGFAIPSPYFDLAVGSEGLLWVVNPGRTRVEAYTYDGDFELAWGKPSLKDDGFNGCCNPVHLAVDPTGGFVTSEKGIARIKHHGESGEFECLVAGPDELRAPEATKSPGEEHQTFDVAVDSKGRVLVLDAARQSVRIFLRKESAGRG
jgi:hypothetical protein